jgi:hypothetical protein
MGFLASILAVITDKLLWTGSMESINNSLVAESSSSANRDLAGAIRGAGNNA